jgi:hypothetical protein
MATDRGRHSEAGVRAVKPAAAELGVNLAGLDWQRSGTADGALEVAFVPGPDPVPDTETSGQTVKWVLLRVAGDPAGRILVYDRVEWLNFLDGATKGEFDCAAE